MDSKARTHRFEPHKSLEIAICRAATLYALASFTAFGSTLWRAKPIETGWGPRLLMFWVYKSRNCSEKRSFRWFYGFVWMHVLLRNSFKCMNMFVEPRKRTFCVLEFQGFQHPFWAGIWFKCPWIIRESARVHVIPESFVCLYVCVSVSGSIVNKVLLGKRIE